MFCICLSPWTTLLLSSVCWQVLCAVSLKSMDAALRREQESLSAPRRGRHVNTRLHCDLSPRAETCQPEIQKGGVLGDSTDYG